MNWDCIEGQWKQQRGKAVQHWGKMMNDELAAIAGKYEELVGRIQEAYGVAREEARRQAARYRDTAGQLKEAERRLVELQKSPIGKRRPDRTGRKKSGLKTTAR